MLTVQLPVRLHLAFIGRSSRSPQLQVSSMSLPSRSIKDRKSAALSSGILPTFIAAFLMAALTAMGILFEDLMKTSQSVKPHSCMRVDGDHPEM